MSGLRLDRKRSRTFESLTNRKDARLRRRLCKSIRGKCEEPEWLLVAGFFMQEFYARQSQTISMRRSARSCDLEYQTMLV